MFFDAVISACAAATSSCVCRSVLELPSNPSLFSESVSVLLVAVQPSAIRQCVYSVDQQKVKSTEVNRHSPFLQPRAIDGQVAGRLESHLHGDDKTRWMCGEEDEGVREIEEDKRHGRGHQLFGRVNA
jgi:hypothetical protein